MKLSNEQFFSDLRCGPSVKLEKEKKRKEAKTKFNKTKIFVFHASQSHQ